MAVGCSGKFPLRRHSCELARRGMQRGAAAASGSGEDRGNVVCLTRIPNQGQNFKLGLSLELGV